MNEPVLLESIMNSTLMNQAMIFSFFIAHFLISLRFEKNIITYRYLKFQIYFYPTWFCMTSRGGYFRAPRRSVATSAKTRAETVYSKYTFLIYSISRKLFEISIFLRGLFFSNRRALSETVMNFWRHIYRNLVIVFMFGFGR